MSTAYQTSPAFILVCGFGIDFHQPPDQRHIESRGSMEAQEEALIMQEVLMNHSRMIGCDGNRGPSDAETDLECPIVKKNAIQIP
jgi:hypothetical protein